MKQQLTLLLLLICFIEKTNAQHVLSDSISQEIALLNATTSLPGFSVAIVNENGLLYQDSFGYANIESEEKFTTKTIQRMGSVSKTIIALCVMKLIEENKISLHTKINTLLPTPIYNPNFPNHEITIEHLVTHTSGILDDEKMYWNYTAYLIEDYKKNLYPKFYRKVFKKWKNNRPKSLKEYCYVYLNSKGKYFTENTFGDYPPGDFVNYSNIGASLTAYLIELVSGKSFKEFSQEVIFDKLNLNHSYWSPEIVPDYLLAQPYGTEDLLPFPNYVDIGYPEGGWHTNVVDLGNYLSDMIRGHKGKGALLLPNSYQIMMNGRLNELQLSTKHSKSKANTGVFWTIATNGEIRHDGGFLGASVFMRFNPNTGIGKIFMTNILLDDNPKATKAFINVWKTLTKYENKLD